MELSQKIEGLLFATGEPMETKKIAAVLGLSQEEVKNALEELSRALTGRGIVLLHENNQVTLGTSPELSSILEEIRKEELNKELSKASLETLAIITYKNGATRSDIDYIRGVNSSFILRNLSVRGLIEREIDANDSRRFVYRPSIDILRYLGVSSIEEMPEFDTYKDILSKEVALNTDTTDNE